MVAWCRRAPRSSRSEVYRVKSLVSKAAGLAALSALLVGCAASQDARRASDGPRGFSPSVYGVSASTRVVQPGQAVPRGGGVHRVGRSYTIRGRTYHPRHDPSHDEVGIASWYGDDFHGRRTANGEIYNMYALSAAHRTLPMPSYVRVQNVQNGRSVVVRVNDRGPFHGNRVIDVSKRVAQVLDLKNSGLARVRVTYVGRADLSGNDDWLVTTVQDNGRAVSPTQVAAMAPVPAWAATPATGPTPTQLALQDRLAPSGPPPVPLERPRDQPVQVASIAPIVVPPSSRMPTAPILTTSAAPPLPAVVTQALAPAPSAGPVTAPATVAAAASGAPLALTPLPPARPAIASPAAQPAAAGAPIFVQVGSFRDPQQAMRYRDALARHGTAVVEPVNVSGITFHQLRVGPFRQQAQAEGAMREAQSLGATNARISGI